MATQTDKPSPTSRTFQGRISGISGRVSISTGRRPRERLTTIDQLAANVPAAGVEGAVRKTKRNEWQGGPDQGRRTHECGRETICMSWDDISEGGKIYWFPWTRPVPRNVKCRSGHPASLWPRRGLGPINNASKLSLLPFQTPPSPLSR